MLKKALILLGLPLVIAACEENPTAPVDAPSAEGVATQFREVLHTIEFHPVPKINLTARGYILPEDGGGSFRYNVNWQGLTVDDIQNVQIVIQQ